MGRHVDVREDAVIGRRTLHLNTGSTAIEILIFLPRPIDGDVMCRFTVSWPDRVESGVSRGADSIQAMLLAVSQTHALVLASEEARSGGLDWSTPAATTRLFLSPPPCELCPPGQADTDCRWSST